MHYALHYFDTAKAAREYRREHGTGGWIFEPDNGGACILFPPHIPPFGIFNHGATRGQSGRLIGSQ